MVARKVHDITPSQTTERFLLVGSFFAGAIGIIAIKMLSPWAWLSAAWAVGVLTLYLLGSLLLGRIKIEPESIGDNCYYLGFLYTLTSLAVTLFQLKGSGTDQAMGEVIAGFGVALASTIFGVLYRVLLMQLKVDYVARELEERAHLLALSRDFRMQLAESVKTFKSFGLEVSQHESELLKRTTESFDVVIEEITKRFDKKSEQMAEQFHDALRKGSEAGSSAIVDGISASVDVVTERFTASAGAISGHFARLSEQQQRLVSELELLQGKSSESVKLFGQSFTQTGIELSQVQQAIRESSISMSRSLEDAQLLLRETNEQIARTADLLTTKLNAQILDGRVSALFETLESVTKESADAMSRVKIQLDGLDESISRVAQAINASSEKITTVPNTQVIDSNSDESIPVPTKSPD
jgi:hypothetical protein